MQIRKHLDAIKMQFICNLDTIFMKFRRSKDVIQTFCLVLYSYLTFSVRVGWMEKWGTKLFQLSIEVEVEAELNIYCRALWPLLSIQPGLPFQ